MRVSIRSLARKIISKIRGDAPYFATDDVVIGKHVHFGRNVVFNCKKVRIGDGVSIYDNVKVDAEVFEIGDYGTIYDSCFFPGPGELRIGHNFWLGTASIVDAKGGTTIGNNVGIGAHSQLWTHMIYGDVMYGCRFSSVKPLNIGNDVWLVGHCLVSPVNIGDRSLAMLGSLVTRDMEPDHSYAGVPARDMTDKLGPQFEIRPLEDRRAYLEKRLAEFGEKYRSECPTGAWYKIVTSAAEMNPRDRQTLYFNVADRTYTKRNTDLEYKLIRFLLPDAKFVPHTT